MIKFKSFLLSLIVLLVTFSFGFSSISRPLIDFTTYEENINKIIEKDNQIHDQIVSDNPDLKHTDFGYYKVELSAADWSMTNWDVVLTSSSARVKNRLLSYTTKVRSEQFNGDVMGARIHFLKGRYLSWAIIKPRYEFFKNYEDGSYLSLSEEGVENPVDEIAGVLFNVGNVKSVSAWIYGLNYKYQVAVRTLDRHDQIKEYPLGNVYYDGWRRLKYVNEEYTDDIRDRILDKLPLYPLSYPTMTFQGFVVYKPQSELGGDFVTYFKDVTIEYDRGIIREDMDIEDEKVWGIITKRRLNERARQVRLLGDRLHLEDQARRAEQLANTTEAEDNGAGAAAAE